MPLNKTPQQELAEYLADAYQTLDELSVNISGGFERIKEIVQEKVKYGLSFPEALYSVTKEIIEGKYE